MNSNVKKNIRALDCLIPLMLVLLLFGGCREEKKTTHTTVMQHVVQVGDYSYRAKLLYTSEDPSTTKGLVRFSPITLCRIGDPGADHVSAVDPPDQNGYEVVGGNLSTEHERYQQGDVLLYDAATDEFIKIGSVNDLSGYLDAESFQVQIEAWLVTIKNPNKTGDLTTEAAPQS